MNGSATPRHAVVLLPDTGEHEPLSTIRHGRPFLWWQLRELQRFGVREFTLIGPAPIPSDTIADLRAAQPHDIQITALEAEATPAGVASLLNACGAYVLVVWGGHLFAGNLARCLSAARDSDLPWRIAVPDRADDRLPLLLRRDHLSPVATDWEAFLCSDSVGWQTCVLDGPVVDVCDHTFPDDVLHRAAVFLDRDGVINIDHGWVGTRERFEWTEGVFKALRTLTDRGYHLFIVTNQSGIARGFYDEPALHALMEWVIDEIRAHGATIDDWRYCPYHPDAPLDAFRRNSSWRKPGPGMILDLMERWQPALGASMLFGDQPSDLEAASAAGLCGYRVGAQSLAELVSARFRSVPPAVPHDTRDESDSRET